MPVQQHPSDACLTPTSSRLALANPARAKARSQFDAWGYTKVLDTSDATSLIEVAQITIPETADPDFVAYFSWYAGAFRVADISDPANPVEVGHGIDDAGNNFWG